MTLKTYNPKSDGVDAEFHDLKDDEMATRLVEAPEGRKFNLVQDAVYNLWTIKPTKGPVPTELSHKYTSESEARKGIEKYLGKNKKLS